MRCTEANFVMHGGVCISSTVAVTDHQDTTPRQRSFASLPGQRQKGSKPSEGNNVIGGLCEITENLIGDEGELGGVVEMEG